jgi:hypothetical protein
MGSESWGAVIENWCAVHTFVLVALAVYAHLAR